MLTLLQQITAARDAFTSNSALTALYVTPDGMCFQTVGGAEARSIDITGVRTNYFLYLKASNTIVDAIAAAGSSGAVDTALASSTDATLISIANDRKAVIAEAARVTTKLDYVVACTSIPDLNLLKYREDNEALNAAIDARIIAIS